MKKIMTILLIGFAVLVIGCDGGINGEYKVYTEHVNYHCWACDYNFTSGPGFAGMVPCPRCESPRVEIVE